MGSDLGPVYAGSDGCFYTDWQVDRKLRLGEWKACLYDREDDKRLVGTGDGDLLLLCQADVADLPEWVQICSGRAGPRVVDTRRVKPL
ncbi:hypothetical protein ACYJ1Y_03400 [Natrialbaceae archaeon A-gly3]